MAGTRLVIQTTILVKLLLLIGIAAYFGLCRNNDVLCTPLFGQGGRSLLVLPTQWNEPQVFKERESLKSLRRYQMHVTLVLEDGSDWSEWASELSDVLSKKNLVDHPCLAGPIRTELVLDASLSVNARAVANDANETEYRISGTTVKKWLTSQRNQFDDSRLDVLLCVPQKTKSPLYIKLKDMKPAMALTWEQKLLTIVESIEDNRPVENAMAYVYPFLQDECLLSSNSTEWWQQLVHDTHERARDKVLINHEIMTKSSLKVAITNEVAQQWKKSMQLVDMGVQTAEQGDYVTAVEYLEESLAVSQRLLTDAALMEPIDMQNDHYMAVFFPLVFPLLFPLVFGLIREVKRYRKLKSGESESSKKD